MSIWRASVGLLALVIGLLANADDWKVTYEQLPKTEQVALHDDYDAEGKWIGSRYFWIKLVEEYDRPRLQKDKHLWKKVEMLCKACGRETDGPLKKELFDELRRQRDEQNAKADEIIAMLFADDSGEYRRTLAKEDAESAMEAFAELELLRLESSLRKAKQEVKKSGAYKGKEISQ